MHTSIDTLLSPVQLPELEREPERVPEPERVLERVLEPEPEPGLGLRRQPSSRLTTMLVELTVFSFSSKNSSI